jgi:DNA-3-methyladenine glycosylase
MKRLRAEFYARPTLEVLEDLIGKVLVHEARGVRTAGMIVEAEAYIGEADPACHAAPGPTARNAPLYGPPGRAYVYLNYGIHSLVNAVTEAEGSPAAILIRALAPLEGIPVMRRRRLSSRRGVRGARLQPGDGEVRDGDLCRGPGNLTVALGIGLRHNRADLTRGPLAIEDHAIRPGTLAWSPRIGIRVGTDRRWRCYVAESVCVSGRRNGSRFSGDSASLRSAP